SGSTDRLHLVVFADGRQHSPLWTWAEARLAAQEFLPKSTDLVRGMPLAKEFPSIYLAWSDRFVL
ncbi:MAG: hypothetical protein WCK77_25485, partial [Verrucomicrobiota bacterium]